MQERLEEAKKWAARQPYRLWWTQLRAVVRLEAKRNVFAWRSLWIYFLGFIPVVIIGLHTIVDPAKASGMGEDTMVLAGIFQLYYMRLGIFFGCLGIFSRLIRGEMVERSLHYYLLSPVRREILLLGKFIAGCIAALAIFESAVFLSFTLIYAHYGAAGQAFVMDGPGLGQLEAYMGITALACLGYGSIFMLLSMLFKNPTPAAMIFMGWEFINPILPSLLQKLSIASYLRHLLPVSGPMHGVLALLTVVTEPVRPWAAAMGVLILTTVVVGISCYRMRKLEIRYTTE